MHKYTKSKTYDQLTRFNFEFEIENPICYTIMGTYYINVINRISKKNKI